MTTRLDYRSAASPREKRRVFATLLAATLAVVSSAIAAARVYRAFPPSPTTTAPVSTFNAPALHRGPCVETADVRERADDVVKAVTAQLADAQQELRQAATPEDRESATLKIRAVADQLERCRDLANDLRSRSPEPTK
jgi:hypothetical protein